MKERIRLGYVKEFFRGMDLRSWVANLDMESEDPVVQRDVQRWLHGVSHPMTTHSITVHGRLSGETIYPDCPWVAEYTAHMHDQVYAVAFGYGKTEEEAVINVKNMIQENVSKYYIPIDDQEPTFHFDEAKFIAELEAKHREENENE